MVADANREPKPDWSTVPQGLRAAIEARLAGRIVKASTVWGGYTPSATFRLALDDGREVFCKANHFGQTEHGRQAFAVERAFFRDTPAIAEFTPGFLGDVTASEWEAMLFEFIGDRVSVPPWTESRLAEVLAKIARLHALDAANVPSAQSAWASPFLGTLLQAKEGFAQLAASAEARTGFASLFADPREAGEWLERHLADLVALEARAPELRWRESLVHLDLRSDNVLISASRGPLVIDWPFLSVGPTAFDIAFFAPSIEGEGGPEAEKVFALYAANGGTRFDGGELSIAAALTAGFFAAHAFLPPLEALPRLRWIQRVQLHPALRWLCRRLDIAPPPLASS